MALTTRRGALTTHGAALTGTFAPPAHPASAGARRHRPRPLRHAHAPNDCAHPRPLFGPRVPPPASNPTAACAATAPVLDQLDTDDPAGPKALLDVRPSG
ncbi:hypothetical protein [Streptomyces sp. AGS-58]|uniref:hypothetical protein n=1 Tax=unclassified Streptomyces TaxID=2593676 RepID=UPI0035A3A52A